MSFLVRSFMRISPLTTARSSLSSSVGLGQQRFKSIVSADALKNLEHRWTKLPEIEKAAIADELAALEKGDWKKMTLDQKRAAYFIAYGPWGARAKNDPIFKKKVLLYTGFYFGLAIVAWQWFELQFKPKLRTQTPEWQAASLELAKERKQNPFTNASTASQ